MAMPKLTKRRRAQVALVLRKALEELRPKGAWTQGAMFRDRFGASLASSQGRSCCCLVGAILVASPADSYVRDDTFSVLRSKIVERSPHSSIPTWNDTPGRTKRQVMALLNAARRELLKTC